MKPGKHAVFFSDNDCKYDSMERARQALGYDPQDDSAHFDGEERVVERDV